MSPLEGNSIRRPSVYGADAEASGFQFVRGAASVVVTLAVGIGLSDADTFAHAARMDDRSSDGMAAIQDVAPSNEITEVPREYAADFVLLKPIRIEFDSIHGNIVACFREAQLSFAGVNRHDAQEHLLDWILGTYDSLVDKDPLTLGPIPTRQLDVLKRHVRRA